MKTYTRKQYLNKECTHREYTSQFVTESTKRAVLSEFSMEELTKRLEGGDIYFNGDLYRWDSLPTSCNRKRLEECGDYLTPAGWVSIAKEAARQLVEQNKAK